MLVIKRRRSHKVELRENFEPYAYVNKPHRPLPTPDGKRDYREMDDLGQNGRPSYHEIAPIIPQPAKVCTLPPQVKLKHNPMYDSKNCLDDMPANMSDSRESVDSALMTEFNIYARPMRPPVPPVPPYRGTPDPADFEALHNEKLDPSMFRSRVSSACSSLEASQLHPYSSIYAEPELIQRSDVVEVTEKNISELKELGMGQFGQVVLAHTVGISLRDLKLSNSSAADGISILVAVKKLKSDADDETRDAFEKEIKFMARLHHENVVRLLGVCLQKQAFILMEYMENGDLNQYLQKHELTIHDIHPLPEATLSTPILIYISLQIASGMRYLSSHNCIHRDLATRNCLVGQKNIVKIADFGMSRNLYSSVYYRVQGRAMLPIRWMANECFYGRFSEKTDIWAFGVTMWEIFTLGKEVPYPDLLDQEVIDDAIRGKNRTIPSQPEKCPPEAYHVMLRCWEAETADRADFEEVYNLLAQIHAYSDIA